MRVASYLFRRGSIYYFRWVLPRHLQAQLLLRRPADFRLSLRTGSRKEADQRTRELCRAMDLCINSSGGIASVQSVGEIATLLAKAARTFRMTRTPLASALDIEAPLPIAQQIGTYELRAVQRVVAELRNNGASLFVPVAGISTMLFELDCTSDALPPTYRPIEHVESLSDPYVVLLSDSVTKAVGAVTDTFDFQEFLSNQPGFAGANRVLRAEQPIVHNVTSISALPSALLKLLPSHTRTEGAALVHTQALERVRISAALLRWSSVNTSSVADQSGWKPKTVKSATSAIALLLEVLGDKIASDVTTADAEQYYLIVKRLPPNRRKRAEFRHLSASEAADKNADTKGATIGSKTILENLQWCSAFFSYLVSTRICSFDPFEAMREIHLKKFNKIDPMEARDPFSDAHLKLIFESSTAMEHFRRAAKNHPANVWIPLLGAYTGARISELAELRALNVVDDLQPYIYVAEFDTTRRLKSSASTRKIPLHKTLVELGFLKYAETIQRRCNQDKLAPLFPSLPAEPGVSMRPVSRFFNDTLLDKLGINDKKLTFHSFRHTVSQKFRLSDMTSAKRDAFMGHKNPSASQGDKTYGQLFEASDLTPLLNALDYSIDWSRFRSVLDATYAHPR